MPRTRVSSRIANAFVRAIVMVTVAMCSSGGHALVARSSIAQLSSSASPIAAGATHSMAVTPSGQVWTWGDNRVGQLGTGDTVSHASPVPVAGLSNEFIAVSAGLGHSLALDYLGRVWSWGLNSDGQLGEGSRTRRLSPILVAQANDVVAIAAGTVHSLALRIDGRVLAWGGNIGAQLGDGTNTGRTRPVLITGLTDVIAIAAGTAHSLALRSDGSVWAWGTNLTGQLGVTGALLQRRPVRIPSLANIALISAGGGHSVAVTASGQGWSWGWNAFGQLGDGTRTMRRTPIAIQGVAEVSRISAGATHTLATTSAGELFAWGGNDAGQLGDGTTTNRLTPTFIQPPPSQVIEVAAGAVHSLLLAADRSAWSWGNNFFGQLGDGSHVTSRRPTPISGLAQTVAAPTFSPEGGGYDAPIEVTISTTTPNAVIHYTTNGDDPTESDPVADAPLVIDQTTILSARAFKAGMTGSDVSIAEYVFAVLPPPDAPTFSHEGGFFSSPIDVSIATTTPDAEIRYTLDGSEPHAASELYTGPLHIATGTTIRARAFLGGRGSNTSGVSILFDFGQAATPAATPAAGMYTPPLNVTLTAQPGTSIYFTLDGGVPSESSTLYVSPIAIAATATLRARAFHLDYRPSRVLTVAYVVDDSPTGPTVDPSTIASPVDPTEQTEFAEATAFLYTGPNRIQRGVAADAIVAARVTVLRGMVRDRNGAPIGGVRITALNEPGLGHTLTREDGMFDFAVNGGGRVAIDYVADGYLPVQRTIPAGWNDYVWAPDVVLTALDPNVTVIPMASSEALAARGSAVTDADGTRQATLIVPEGGVVANIELADGTRLSAVSQLSIRATEYTVGPNGRAAMPGNLPNTSGYTYAVELSADEAIAAHATRVTFDRPLPFYVENFLGFPVGGAVPTGYFDRQRGEWVASDNGRIVGIVSETGGAADLDLNGDAIADDAAALTALGVTDGERRRLAVLYEPGQSLWRVPIPHFTPWDHNWPYRVPEDADHPNAPPPEQRDRVNDGCEVQHSIVECESQALGERVGVTGTPFTLNYRSNRQPGSAGPSTITIPLTGARVPASLRRIDLEVRIAGRRFLQTFPPTAGVKATIIWDGKDAYGRTVYGGHAATATIKHAYGAIYTQPALLPRSFAQAGNGPIFVDRSANEFVFEQISVITMRSAMSPAATIGGWSLDAHHVFDRIGNTIWLGDGGRRDAGRSGYDLKEWDPYVRGERLNGVLPDGSAMVSNTVDFDTFATREGGRGGLWTGDHPPECQTTPFHSFYMSLGLASGSGGQLYYAVTNLISGHTVTRLCFGRANRTGPENTGIFTSILLPQPQVQVKAYLATDTSGVIYAAAGPYLYQLNPGANPVLAYTAPATIIGLSLMPGGDVIMATKGQSSSGAGQLRRRSVSGQVTVIGGAATGACTAPRLDGPFDPTAVICVNAVTAARDGSIIYADFLDTGSFSGSDSLVRRLWPDGFVTTLARTSTFISGLAIVQDDEIYATDGRLKSIVPALAENLAGAAAITSADGALVYEFAPSGRHLRTRDAVTGVAYFTFGYNPQGFLISVTDREGQVTTIERDGAGTPQAIVGPYGHRTSLQVNTDGYLTSIADPLGGTTTLDYRAGGLLTMFGTPNGHASQFDYDDGGRLTSDRDGAGGELTLTRTNLPNGWSVQTADSLGRQDRYTVEETAPGRHLRTKELADGTTWTRQDLADGSEDVAADGTRRRVVMAPDPRFGQQAAFPTSVTTTLPSGLANTVTVTRSVQNVLFSNPPELIRIDEITSIGGRQYSKRHDVTTRTITRTSPANRQTVTTFDAVGRPLSARVGTSLLPTTFTYDARGRLTTQRQGPRTTTFAYDAGGSLASVTDPLLRTVQFTSDLARRRTSQTFPDLREATFAYDANGNLISLTPPGRPAHTMTYTPVNLLENYTAPILASPTVTQYQFDLANQPTAVTRADGQQITWAYDTAGRPETLTTPTGTTSYAYHPTTGQLSSLTSPSGGLTYRYDGALQTGETFSGFVSGVVTWDYDSLFRVTTERVNGSSPITFTYDADNLLTGAGAVTYTRRADDGFLLATALGSAVTTYTYSGFGELATEESRHATAVLYSAVYTRDNGGRLTERAETIGGAATTDAYSYDLAGRLTAVTRGGALLVSYTYDANGNRTSVTTSAGTLTATYDDQDRILTFGDRTYTHVAHGEVRGWTDGSGATTLAYDVQGNLIAVSLPTGTTVEYVVDARNRRIGRRVNGAVTHGWLYQGQLRPIAELDSTGAVVSRFVYGARAVAPEIMIRGGITYRLVTDHLGSVRLVVDAASGIVAQRLDYDPSGRVLSDSNPGFQPFGYAGGLFDSLTGLVRFGARDYDASIGRWLSKDPIGFRGGDSNLYAYAGNDPINSIDPTGLFVWEVIDVITFIQDVRDFLGCPGVWTGVAVVIGAIGVLPGVTAIGWVDNVAKNADSTLVIGRGRDLDKGLGSGEFRLQWDPKSTVKEEWKENAGRLRAEMKTGNPIRDASAPDDTGGMYLNAERALLQDRGWTYNPGSGYWLPPR